MIRKSKRTKRTREKKNNSFSLKVMFPKKIKTNVYVWDALDIKPKFFMKSNSNVLTITLYKQFELIAKTDLPAGTAIPYFGTHCIQNCPAFHNQYIASTICNHPSHAPMEIRWRADSRQNNLLNTKSAYVAFKGLGIAAFANEPGRGFFPNTCIQENERFMFLIVFETIKKNTPITTYYGQSYNREKFKYNYTIPDLKTWHDMVEHTGSLYLSKPEKKKLKRYQRFMDTKSQKFL